jgi:hypothetical protein
VQYADSVENAAVAIPDKVIRFLEHDANIAVAGTRDRDLVPAGHRVAGWLVSPEGHTLTVLFPEVSAARVIDAMRDNGQLAATFEQIGTHETYQLKGRYLAHRPVRPEEMAVGKRARDRFVNGLRSLYANEQLANMLGASVPPPALAVDMAVVEVFLQTPGPGAGSRIVPPPA